MFSRVKIVLKFVLRLNLSILSLQVVLRLAQACSGLLRLVLRLGHIIFKHYAEAWARKLKQGLYISVQETISCHRNVCNVFLSLNMYQDVVR